MRATGAVLRQRSPRATDACKEQGLEVARCPEWGRRPGTARGQRSSVTRIRLCKWIGSGGHGIGGEARRGRQTRTRGNPMNPMVGSRMQQACKPLVEQAVAVVQNHEDGTRKGLGSPMPKAPGSATFSLAGGVKRPRMLGVDTSGDIDGGVVFGKPWRSCSATSRVAGDAPSIVKRVDWTGKGSDHASGRSFAPRWSRRTERPRRGGKERLRAVCRGRPHEPAGHRMEVATLL